MAIERTRNRRGKRVRRVRDPRQCQACFDARLPLNQSRAYCPDCKSSSGRPTGTTAAGSQPVMPRDPRPEGSH
jgi:predicted Zn-ribbon and HTH transcriptional regulator